MLTELLRPAVAEVLRLSGGPLVGGMVAFCVPEQTARRSQGGGGHTHTAEETAPGRATRLGWPGQVRGLPLSLVCVMRLLE